MDDGNLGKKLLVGAVVVLLVGIVGWWLIKALFGLVFYLIVGALLIGGGIYLYGKVKNSIGRGPGRRGIGR